MKNFKIIFIFTLILFYSSRIIGAVSEAGAIFLIIYPGARPNGMGAVFTAIADDGLATYYNDGGLGFQTQRDIGLMHVNWLPGLYPGMYYEFFSFVRPTTQGVIGGHIIYLTTGETIGTDETGKEVGRWTTFDVSIKVSYGKKMNEKLSLGVGAKFIYSFLVPAEIVWRFLGERGGGTGRSWAFDFGLLYQPRPIWKVGVALQNLGPNISYTETGEADPLPWTFRLGVSLTPIWTKTNKINLSTELTNIVVGIGEDLRNIQRNFTKGMKSLWEETWRSIGCEYIISNVVILRVGYFADVVGHRIGPTYGGGIVVRKLRFDIGVDSELYEFPTQNYRLSLHYSF